MDFRLADAYDVLARTPGTLDSWLRGLPEPLLTGNEGPDTFSPFDVVGHLIHGERTDWMPRLRRILEHGTSVPFDRYDRFAQNVASKGKTIGELLDTFRLLRAENLRALKALSLTPEQLRLEGTHPQLGRVTAEQLLATWVVHDVSHLQQIGRVMSKQYRDAVGPWTEFFKVFDR